MLVKSHFCYLAVNKPNDTGKITDIYNHDEKLKTNESISHVEKELNFILINVEVILDSDIVIHLLKNLGCLPFFQIAHH